MADAPKGTRTVITEAELQKSLQALEGTKVEDVKPARPARVEVVRLAKRAHEVIAERASGPLRKALDVSDALNEVVDLMGIHVQDSLEAFQKSIDAGAQRDATIVKVIEKMSKSIDDLKVAVEAMGKAPAGGPRTIMTPAAQVLHKSAGAASVEGEPAAGATKLTEQRQAILSAFERMAKSADRGSQDQQRWINAASTFESTGRVTEKDLNAARDHMRKTAA